MNKQTLVKILAVGLGIAAAFGAGGCDNGNSDPVCECPNGTVHVTDDNTTACCDGTDCTCTREQKTWALDCGISLDNQSNASIAANISKVDGAVASVNARLVDRIKGLEGAKIIVESDDNASFALDGNAVKISINSLNNQTQLSGILKNAFSEIAAALNEYYLDYNVKVVNQTGGQFREGLIDDIENAMDAINGTDNSLMTKVSSRNASIIITSGNEGESGEVDNGNTIKIGSQFLPDSINTEVNIYVMFLNMITKSMALNNINSDIRLALASGNGRGNARVPGTFFLV
jgi:hypothetical protein